MNVQSVLPEMQAKHFQMEGEMERKENYLDSEKLFLFLSNHCLNLKRIIEYNAKWPPLQASTQLCEENVMTNGFKINSLFSQRLWKSIIFQINAYKTKYIFKANWTIKKENKFIFNFAFHVLINLCGGFYPYKSMLGILNLVSCYCFCSEKGYVETPKNGFLDALEMSSS